MSETQAARSLAQQVARAADLLSALADQVSGLDQQSLDTDPVARDIAAMAFAACDAELHAMTAVRGLLAAMQAAGQASAGSDEAAALADAVRQLDIAEARIAQARRQIQGRDAAAGSAA
jgi:hypothetical protein